MATITYQDAVRLIGDRARRGAFDDAAVQSLAVCFKTVSILSTVPLSVVGAKVEPYAVVGEDNEGKPRVVFQATAAPSGERIPSAFIVPTVLADDMEQVEVKEKLVMKTKVPAFRAPTNPPTKNTWKLLDLGVASPHVIITTQLSGCTFAIGTVGRKYYMGHAQPPRAKKQGELTGEAHAKNLRKGPVFNGLPANTKLESTFFIQIGDKNGADTLAYTILQSANVLGFVVGTKVSFIVAILRWDKVIEKVFVVTQASPSKWNIKQV